MEQGLVSIITPCYNGAAFAGRFLDSVLAQTYPRAELFFINDGSTDDTERIALSYREAFAEKGYDYTYLSQPNGGQASAVNRGLARFRGEFLTWPDSDDALTPDALQVKVDFLNAHPECGGVVCGIRSLDDRTGELLEEVLRFEPDEPPRALFWDFFWERGVAWCPGAYFLRSDCFLEVNPARRIFESREGQNYQILLPMMYHYRFGYLDRYLYDYYHRRESHSNLRRDPYEYYLRKTNTQIMYAETIASMPCSEEERAGIQREVQHKFLPIRLQSAAKALRRDLVRETGREAKAAGLSARDRCLPVVRGALARLRDALRGG